MYLHVYVFQADKRAGSLRPKTDFTDRQETGCEKYYSDDQLTKYGIIFFLYQTDMTEISPTTWACISKVLYLIKTRSVDTEDKWIDCNTLYILASNISWHHLFLNASYTQNCLKCFEWIADRGRSTFIKPVLNKVLLDPKYQGQIYCLRMLFTDLEWHAPFQS